MNYKNLVDALMDRREESRGITFIESSEDKNNGMFLSYNDIFIRAVKILHHLQARGLNPGDQLIFQLSNNTDFIVVFWACLLGKIIPVPISVGITDEYRLKVFNIWRLLDNPYLITSENHLGVLESFAEDNNKHELFKQMKRRTIFAENLQPGQEEGKIHLPRESDLAYVQFSSGSTGEPKGVILTHKNLITNTNALLNGFAHPGNGIDRYFSWMPLTHDMGLVCLHLTPLVGGWDQVLMDPQLFIRQPTLWLKKMSTFKSTLTASPNFGYKYVLKHFDPSKNQGLDLSHIRIIVNGAEPISPQLCDGFLRTMAPFGLRRNAILPGYGLAEATVAVTLDQPQEEIKTLYLDRKSLNCGEKVRSAGNNLNTVSFVEVGTPLQKCFVKIVDDNGNTCEPNVIGEILVRGDNVTSGYYNNSVTTSRTITPDGWLRTGDLGFLRNGRLVITGRLKEIIFVNGQNYYPHDMERVIQELEETNFEKVAVCGIYNPELQQEEIVCFVVFKKSLGEFLPLAAALKNHMIEKMAVEISKVIPVKKIPKTTSGKLQRLKLKKQYLEGDFHAVLEEITQLQKNIMPPTKGLSRQEIKRRVTETWCEVLDLENVAENQNFFDMGGTSSSALQVKGKLQELLGKAIDDTVIFRYPTISKLTDLLSTENAALTFLTEQKQHLDLYSKERKRIRTRLNQSATGETGKDNSKNGLEIAVIGMSGRFPGASDINEFWENLKNGVESISFFSGEELTRWGVDAQLLHDPNYIKAKGVLQDLDYFDAAFFNYSPPEAEKMDPQMGLLHECSWEALENAGYDPGQYRGLIGVYVGASPNRQWELTSILSAPSRLSSSDEFVDTQLIDKDFMTTRLSYALDLKGPSFSMYTACSTSLVAVDLACQGLQTGRCDMALAGGISIWLPHKSGYLYEDGMLFSRNGHNRTFDEQASGTVFSDGAGMVLLKRLEEATADKDNIYAVIKGSAINNDGHRKAGYTAPALEGQAEVVASALQMAEVEPESIGYLEAHGTATSLGDSIEMDALNLVFQCQGVQKTKHCAIGSVKSNVGHLNAAAGIAGLIKTSLMLKYRQIPPSLHFNTANPRIDFDCGPFYVNTRLKEWENNSSPHQPHQPRRAGVSSFGIGGTNAHVILEEAPEGTRGLAPLSGEEAPAVSKSVNQWVSESVGQYISDSVGQLGNGQRTVGRGGSLCPPSETGSREYQFILLSAKSPTALDKMTENLAQYLEKNPGINLADAAYTLQLGRQAFPYRRMLLVSNVEEAVAALLSYRDRTRMSQPSRKLHSFHTGEKERKAVFMYAGLEGEYVNMGRELYSSEPVFRREMNRCFEILEPLLDYDIKEILYPEHTPALTSHPSQEGSKVRGASSDGSALPSGPGDSPLERGVPDPRKGRGVSDIEIAQLVVFILEYTLTQLLIKWGIKPSAMIGYSFGEYAAACIAGVISLEDALKLVTARGRLMSETPAGAMLSVPLPPDRLKSLITDELSIAIDNGESCIVSGAAAAVQAFEKKMQQRRFICIHLETTCAVHSRLMEPVLTRFLGEVKKVKLHPPRLPYISNVTGNWITAAEAVNPHYWVRHLRETVRFAEGMKRLFNQEDTVFLEIGPGRALATQWKHRAGKNSQLFMENTMRSQEESIPDRYYLYHRIGYLWLRGVNIRWQEFHEGETRQRIPLPTYPFVGQPWGRKILSRISTASIGSIPAAKEKPAPDEKLDFSRWFHYPSWKLSRLPMENHHHHTPLRVLLFMDACGLGMELAARLEKEGHHMIAVKPGSVFERLSDHSYIINPCDPNHYDMLLKQVRQSRHALDRIFHLWGVTGITDVTGVTSNNSQVINPGIERINHALDYDFYSLTFLAKAVGSQDINEEIRLLVVTDNMQAVNEEEELQPEKATVLGPCRVIPQEYSNFRCQSIDIVLPKPGSKQWEKIISALLEEFKIETSETVAYRGSCRWVREYEPIILKEAGVGAHRNSRLKKGGVYLITGGLGGIGYILAKYLVEEWKARVILTGRTALPPKDQWEKWRLIHSPEDVVNRIIKKVQELESLCTNGAVVKVLKADAAHREEMLAVISRAEECFGSIDGVIHAAGIVGGESMCTVHEINKRRAQMQFQPKIYGLMVLKEVLAGKSPDFVLLMSSMTSILGGLGDIAYSAANLFMDAFALRQNQENNKNTAYNGSNATWISVNWDIWQRKDQDERREISQKLNIGAAWDNLAITPEEGIKSFEYIMTWKGVIQVLQSTSHLQTRIDQWIKLKTLREEDKPKEEILKTSLQERPALLNSYEPPSAPMEQILVKVWQRLLGYEPIGVLDNFFDLGGDSLKAVRMVSRLQKEHHVKIPIKEFFSRPTIAGLVQYIENAANNLFSPIEPVEKKEYYPLSSAQKRMFVLHQLDKKSTSYSVPTAFTLEGQPDIKKMEEVFKLLIKRHESLRTSFPTIDGVVVQQVHAADEAAFALEYYQYRSDDNRSPDSHSLPCLPTAFMMTPFELSRAPLMRAWFSKLGESKYLFMLGFHHIVTDGISLGIFVKELMEYYRGETLAPLPIQYKDYSQWANDNNIKERERIKQQEAYWLKEFAGEIPVLELPVDFSRPRLQSFEGRNITFEVGVEETEALKKLARQEGMTLYMVLLSIYTILLAKITGQDDIVIGTLLASRRHTDLENIIGMFVNALPMRNYPRAAKTYLTFLRELKERTLAAFDNQDYQFEDLIERIGTHRDPGRNPLFDVLFTLENINAPEMELPGLLSKLYLYVENQVTKFDMILAVEESEKKLLFLFEYRTKLFRPETIERFGRYFCNLVSYICGLASETPNETIGDIEIITEDEKKQILHQFNDTTSAYPLNKTIHELFLEQIEKMPDHVALIGQIPNPKSQIPNKEEPFGQISNAFGEMHLSYRELNRKSNQLAGLLRKKGVKPDTIIGLMIERSIEMITSILGILKAGGAYLPIDPQTPQNRIVSMLEDCDAEILLITFAAAEKYSFTDLQGLQYLQSNRVTPYVTAVRPQITDLDSIPFPDRSLINYKKYHKHIGVAMAKHTVPIMASRGCPYNCAYCHKIWPKKHIVRSAENVFDEVRRYYNHGIRRFVILDDIFNLNIKNSSRFYQLVIQHGLDIHLFFPGGVRGDILTPEYIDLMMEAGTINLMMALESASPRIQKLVRKNLRLDKFQENLDYIIKNHPQVILEVNIMHGFPTETEEEALMSLNFVKQHRWIDFPNMNILKIYPNTDMERLAMHHGISREAIERSLGTAYHELPETLPFDKSFTLKCQADLFNDYFMKKERFLDILPHQMKVLSEDEIAQKYDSYLPVDIKSFPDLLNFVGVCEDELGVSGSWDESTVAVPDFSEKMKKYSPITVTKKNCSPLRILLLDLSKTFSQRSSMLYDVVESPLGLMYLLTYLNRQFGGKIKGKITHSRMDFDNYEELKIILEEFNPHVIGVRCLTFYKEFYHKTISLIRLWGFTGPVIAGGPYATSDWKSVLQDRNIDLVVRGEGEITFSEVIGKMLENNGKLPGEEILNKIKGIAFIPKREKERPSAAFVREVLMLDELMLTNGWSKNKESLESLPPINQSGDIAYIIYTSGSTGIPKGVMTTHYNVNRIVRNTNYIDLTPDDRVLQLSNYAFDGSIFDIYGALLNGGALVLLPVQQAAAVDLVADTIEKESITVFFITTALFNLLVDERPGIFHHIRKVLFGGERVSVEHVRRALQYAGKNKIVHVYGPTETTVYATYYFIDEVVGNVETIPIGSPLSNTTVYILDKHMKPSPIRVIGEIYIGGSGNARGYLNNPESTAEKFCLWQPGGSFCKNRPLDPRKNFLLGTGKQDYRSYMSHMSYIYRTGDLGRWLEDGNIEFVGRIDHMVKIRGFRVEPGEIESKLLEHDAINEAVVLVKDGNLCVYIVSSREFTISELREFLSRDLPDYMIPSYCTQLEKIPLNKNGKIDRKSLPDPSKDRPNLGEVYIKPKSDIEKKISRVWKQVLQLDEIGVRDNFFNLGGNSLKAFQLKSQLEKVLGIGIPIAVLFEHVTIGSLVGYLEMMGTGTEKRYKNFQEKADRTAMITKAKQTRQKHRNKRKVIT